MCPDPCQNINKKEKKIIMKGFAFRNAMFCSRTMISDGEQQILCVSYMSSNNYYKQYYRDLCLLKRFTDNMEA